MDNPTNTYTGSPVVNQNIGRKKNPTMVVVITVFVLAIVFGLILYLQNRQTAKPDVNVTTTATPEPTDTPPPTVNKEDVKIQVLNGTGTPGQAGTAVVALTEAGYTEENIETDNATDYDHSVTTIEAKAGFSGIATDIKKALGSKFENITVSSLVLDEDSEFDIIVTTGGKKYEEPTSAPSPTSTATPSATITP